MSEKIEIQTIEVPARGCGLRQQGGFYATGDMPGITSNFFPKSLECACGLQIVRPSRSCQSLFPGKIWPSLTIAGNSSGMCFPDKNEKVWAVTVDTRGYPTPQDWINEGKTAGISRRLNNGLPKGFEIGKSVMFVIHGKAFNNLDGTYSPGFIASFVPKEIQYVVTGKEPESYLRSLAKKGITLVNVTNSRPPKNG